MKANEFVKKFGIYAFRLSVGSVSTRKYLIVYEDEIDFADEIKPSHGECVFDRSEVKRLVESHELVRSLNGLIGAKANIREVFEDYPHDYMRRKLYDFDVKCCVVSKAIADVESCM